MKDYKQILDEQLKNLEGTITRNNEEHDKNQGEATEGGLVNKLLNQAYTKKEFVDVGIKSAGTLTVGYVAGVLLPFVSGPAGAGALLAGYLGKKYVFDKYIKK